MLIFLLNLLLISNAIVWWDKSILFSRIVANYFFLVLNYIIIRWYQSILFYKLYFYILFYYLVNIFLLSIKSFTLANILKDMIYIYISTQHILYTCYNTQCITIYRLYLFLKIILYDLTFETKHFYIKKMLGLVSKVIMYSVTTTNSFVKIINFKIPFSVFVINLFSNNNNKLVLVVEYVFIRFINISVSTITLLLCIRTKKWFNIVNILVFNYVLWCF